MPNRKPVKVKILDMTYSPPENLFKMTIRHLEHKKRMVLAIKGTDFGVTPSVPANIIQKFCEDMKGQTKFLDIQTDNKSIRETEADGEVDEQKLKEVYGNLDNYPINELLSEIQREGLEDGKG